MDLTNETETSAQLRAGSDPFLVSGQINIKWYRYSSCYSFSPLQKIILALLSQDKTEKLIIVDEI